MPLVREAVADMVMSSGSTTVFALMGAANQELMCDLDQRHGLRLVHCRHEAGAVGMADGYARFGAHPGVATVTAGPGVTNTATSLAVARDHRSPVLLLAGDVPRDCQRHPQRFSQVAFTELCAGSSGRIASPEQTGDVLRAAAAALADQRPFVMHLPADLQEAPASGTTAPIWSESMASPVLSGPVDETLLRRSAELLKAGERRVILAGRGALGAAEELGDLASQFGIPLVTTLRAAGLFAGHSLEAGVAGAMGDGRADNTLAAADAVLVVGTSLHPLGASALYRREPRPTLVRIDTAGPAAGTPVIDIDLRAEARSCVAGLLDALRTLCPRRSAPSDRSSGEVVADQRDHSGLRQPGGAVHPLDALDALEELLPTRRLLVIGGGHAALSACQRLSASGPGEFTCVSTDFGAIGQALPVAMGACFAQPGRRVYHVTGDGEFLMALAEFETAVRYQLPLTVVVLNDHGFGQERHNLARARHLTDHATYPSPDLAAVARSLGAVGHRVTRPRELSNLKHALGHQRGVVLVDLHIDPQYLNPASAQVGVAMAAAAQN